MKVAVSISEARRHWINAQRLDALAPFGEGPEATRLAIEHLGYVQIDTINVIERCHHHILFNRIPAYQRADLHHAQTISKTVLEGWTHALSYIPFRDYRFQLPRMNRLKKSPSKWWGEVDTKEFRKLLKVIETNGPLSIRDIDTDVLVEKNHPWASRKPSKKLLEYGFFTGDLVISERVGMLKKYELAKRHFGQLIKQKSATESEMARHVLERALRTQRFVTLDSICHLNAKLKPAVAKEIARGLGEKRLVEVDLEGHSKVKCWAVAEEIQILPKPDVDLIHLLSPFDPLIILRKRLKSLFDYDHRFEAYLPKEKRQFGYFALPVLSEEKIIAVLDLKTDRSAQRLLIQSWHWIKGQRSRANRQRVEEALENFEIFQLNNSRAEQIQTRGNSRTKQVFGESSQ